MRPLGTLKIKFKPGKDSYRYLLFALKNDRKSFNKVHCKK